LLAAPAIASTAASAASVVTSVVDIGAGAPFEVAGGRDWDLSVMDELGRLERRTD
jgi:hypothetical protein